MEFVVISEFPLKLGGNCTGKMVLFSLGLGWDILPNLIAVIEVHLQLVVSIFTHVDRPAQLLISF